MKDLWASQTDSEILLTEICPLTKLQDDVNVEAETGHPQMVKLCDEI
jgi:hypothetical protein